MPLHSSDSLPNAFPPGHRVLNTPVLRPPGEGNGCRHVVFERMIQCDGPLETHLWVSASQRFRIYLNGELLARGPSRSHEQAWNVSRIPVCIHAGTSQWEVRVSHFGAYAGKGQLGVPMFFLLAVENDDLHAELGTGSAWRFREDSTRSPLLEREGRAAGHQAVGAGEVLDTRIPPGEDRDAEVWLPAAENRWGNLRLGVPLWPDPLPPLFDGPVQLPEIVTEDKRTPVEWPLTVPARSERTFQFDAGELVNAYPSLKWAGGEDSTLEMVYCEAPRDPETGHKGNRDVLTGKSMEGMMDRVHSVGGEGGFDPVWFRSFRYVELRVRTVDRPLELTGLSFRATGYPLNPVKPMDGDENRKQLMEVSLRTARLCSHETLFDCPQYEQAQFPGDARVLARFHYRICDDDRLIRKAIDDLHASRLPCGLLHSHSPSTFRQILPTYSLQWIGLLTDFVRERKHPDFVRPYLHTARQILETFLGWRRADGLLRRIPWPPFTDWANGFDAGRAPEESNGGSSIVTCMLAQACAGMRDLEGAAGYPDLSNRWDTAAQELNQSVRDTCLDPEKGLVWDTPARNSPSVHAQVEACLSGALSSPETARALEATWQQSGVIQPGTAYYTAFLWDVFERCGWEERAADLLKPFERMLEETGLTTWPERTDPESRSDCHGWSVVPALILDGI